MRTPSLSPRSLRARLLPIPRPQERSSPKALCIKAMALLIWTSFGAGFLQLKMHLLKAHADDPQWMSERRCLTSTAISRIDQDTKKKIVPAHPILRASPSVTPGNTDSLAGGVT